MMQCEICAVILFISNWYMFIFIMLCIQSHSQKKFTLSFKYWIVSMCDGRDEHVKNTRVPASVPRLDLYVAGGGCGGGLLLPDRGVSLPLCPLQS